jgi:hypothetical protein
MGENPMRPKHNQRAASESCVVHGQPWLRSVDSRRTGRKKVAPKFVNVVGAETFTAVEGSIGCPVMVRDAWPTGVADYGTSAEGLGRNPGGPYTSVRKDPGRTAG